jgi:hypothetical protein
MTHTEQMLATHPRKPVQAVIELKDCIEAALDCEQACIACADACMAEESVMELVKCVRLNLDCAAICQASASILSRQSEPDGGIIQTQLKALATACRICAQECDSHAEMHEHCRVCAEACRNCDEAVASLMNTYPSPSAKVLAH